MKLLFVAASLLACSTAFANDVDPNGFEKQHSTISTMTRAEAHELWKTRTPPSIRIDDQGRAITAPSVKTRAQVVAETAEAARLGLLSYGERAPVQATAAQEQAIYVAGQRAIGHSAASE